MFDLNSFIMKGLLAAVGKMADYKIILNAVGWHEKGVLEEADLSEINEKIEAQYPSETEEITEEITEEE